MPKQLVIRNGLPNLARVIRERAVTIGYLGGSLTMMKEGWRPRLHDWFNRVFPFPDGHRMLHVGRGGVGSASGAFFVQEEICGKDPDIVFVEYAINDSFAFITPPVIIRQAIEGIVRSIKAKHPRCDICFIYTTHTSRRSEIQAVLHIYEQIADHYGIPSINIGEIFWELVETGSWSFQGEDGKPALLRDLCHPSAEGSELMTGHLGRCLLKMLDQPGARNESIGDAICRDSICRGRVEPIRPEMIQGPYERQRRVVGNFDHEVEWYSLPVGSSVEFRPQGTLVGFYTIVGPSAGIIRGENAQRVFHHDLFDRWCHYDRISTCIIVDHPDDMRPGGGAVRLSVTEQRPDYSICAELTDPPDEVRLNVVSFFVV